MRFSDSFNLLFDTTLTDIEQQFKALYYSDSEFDYSAPHQTDEIFDLLSRNIFLKELLPKLYEKELSESSFFGDEFDIGCYQHIRYMPAIWHSHSFFEVVCVLEGECTNHMQKETITMKSGDVMIIAPHTIHALSTFSDDSIILNILVRSSTFEANFLGTMDETDLLSRFFIQTLSEKDYQPFLLFKTNGDDNVRNLVGILYNEYKRNRLFKRRMINNIMEGFFIVLIRDHANDIYHPTNRSLENDQNIFYILQYMQSNFRTITLKELAAFFNYSERHLERIIQAGTGASFKENINQIKMEKALKLLKETQLSIGDIVELLGYSHSSSFRRTFYQYYHITPSEYRNAEKLPAAESHRSN